MEKITIKYSISRTVALSEGRAEYGEAIYQPTDTELQFLTLDDRKYLDTLNLDRSVFALPTGVPPTWPNIADSIKADRQRSIDKAAAELAERETSIVECLAQPDEKWFAKRSDWRCVQWSVDITIPHHCSHFSWLSEDPRVKERVASLQPELARRQAVVNEQNAEAKARQEAAEQTKLAAIEEAAAVKQAAIDELTQWCAAIGPAHLQRAAKEEYDVAGGCLQWLTEQLQASVGGTIVRDNTKLWDRYDWGERKSPGSKSFEVLDTVTAAVKALAHPTSVTVEVERIMLVEIEPAEDDYEDSKREFTGVVVNITHVAAARRCLVVEVKA